MKQTVTILLLFALMESAVGQTIYMDLGNRQLNTQDYIGAERTFRDAIKSDSSNLDYHNQLALSLLKQKKHTDAQKILDKVLALDSINIGALWYAGTNNFLNPNVDLRIAIYYFEKLLPLVDQGKPQYFSANWFIGRSYQLLLQSSGLSYNEVTRMLECYSTYVKLQPNADEAEKITAYIHHISSVRPPENVKKWVKREQ